MILSTLKKLFPPAKNRIFKVILKLGITGVAVYFVFREIDFKDAMYNIRTSDPLYLVLALLTYNISKVIATFRLKAFLRSLTVEVNHKFNIYLYYVGAFYNLFLPGSIGGDGYKVYLLKQRFEEVRSRKLISSVFLDRLSGLVALFSLTMILLFFNTFHLIKLTNYRWLFILAIGIGYGVYYVFLRQLFSTFLSSFHSTNFYSLASQLLQLLTAFFLLKALHIESNYGAYLTLFMVSAVISVLPFTIGGLGARELIFLLGYDLMQIDKTVSISFTLSFFYVLAISALAGLFISFRIDYIQAGKEGAVAEKPAA